MRHSDRPGPDCGHRVTPRAITLPRSDPAPLRQGFDEADGGRALSRANRQPNLAIELLLGEGWLAHLRVEPNRALHSEF